MAAITSFHTEKCCDLVSARAASVRLICSSVRQFLIYSTFELVIMQNFSASFTSPGRFCSFSVSH